MRPLLRGVRDSQQSASHHGRHKYSDEELKIAAEEMDYYFDSREAGIKLTAPSEAEIAEEVKEKEAKNTNPLNLLNQDDKSPETVSMA
jgi:hypothetical protein